MQHSNSCHVLRTCSFKYPRYFGMCARQPSEILVDVAMRALARLWKSRVLPVARASVLSDTISVIDLRGSNRKDFLSSEKAV